jgi:hypothetical protein
MSQYDNHQMGIKIPFDDYHIVNMEPELSSDSLGHQYHNMVIWITI